MRRLTAVFPLRPRRAAIGWLALGQAAGSAWGLAAVQPASGTTPVWSALVSCAVALAVFWPSRAVPRSPAFRAVAATQFLTVLGVCVAFGRAPVNAVWTSLVTVAVSFGVLWLYRRVNTGEGWAPGSALSAFWLFLIIGLTGPVFVLTRATAGIELPGGPAGNPALWSVRIWTSTITGLPASLVLFVDGGRSLLQVRWRPIDVGWFLLALSCFVIPYLVPEYPLAWLFFVPALWAGLKFTPRTVGLLGMGASVLMTVGTADPAWQTDSGLGVPWEGVMALVESVAVCLGLLLVYQREDIARSTARLARQRSEAQAQNAILDGVFRTMHDGLLLADESGALRMVNPAAHRLLGTTVPTWFGAQPATCAEAFTTVDGQPLDPQRVAALRRAPEGARAELTVRAKPQWGDPGRVVSVATHPVAMTDSTYRLMLARDTTAQQEQHHQLKSFAGTVAHDLKNPLTGLTLWMETADASLGAGDLAEGRADLEQALHAAGSMRQVIDDYLAHTVTRHGALRPAEVDLADLVTEVARAYGALNLGVDVRAGHVLLADPGLLGQLIRNLLDNAVKYARSGVDPSVLVTSADDAPGWVRVEMADRGLGLRPGDEERIFRSYTRSGDDGSRSGIGLGLSLCEAIVKRHGGQIRAQSNAWGGATFTFTLPSASLSS